MKESNAEIRRQLADVEAAAARKRGEYDAAEARSQRLRAELAGLLQEAAFLRALLQDGPDRSRMRSTMQLEDRAAKRKSTKIAAGNVKNERPSRAFFLDADRSDADLADELHKKFKVDVGRSTVNAWHTGRRPIPAQYRDYLEEKYPGSGTTWPRVA